MEDMIAVENSWQFSAYQSIKRAFDIVFSLFVLMAFGWLFLLIALAIKVDDSSAPVFFRQVRVGKNGRLFHMWQFRSM